MGIFSIIHVILRFPQKSSISHVSLIPPIPLPPTSCHAAFPGSNSSLLQGITFLRVQTHLALWSSKHPCPVNLWGVRLWQNNSRLRFRPFGLPLTRESALIDKGLSGIPTTTSLPSIFKVLRYGSKGWAAATVNYLINSACCSLPKCPHSKCIDHQTVPWAAN